MRFQISQQGGGKYAVIDTRTLPGPLPGPLLMKPANTFKHRPFNWSSE